MYIGRPIHRAKSMTDTDYKESLDKHGDSRYPSTYVEYHIGINGASVCFIPWYCMLQIGYQPAFNHTSPEMKCHNFEVIFITGYTGSCQNDN